MSNEDALSKSYGFLYTEIESHNNGPHPEDHHNVRMADELRTEHRTK